MKPFRPNWHRARAEELGPVELIALLEWELRDQPRSLRKIRRIYSDFCLALYSRLERARG